MKNAVRRGAALLAVLLAGVCGARAEEADPTVVRVGNITYPRSVVQTALDTDLGLFSLISRQYYTEEDLRGQTEATLHRFIGNGLVENKLAEAGEIRPVDLLVSGFRLLSFSRADRILRSVSSSVPDSCFRISAAVE